jgi:hypothetical protein
MSGENLKNNCERSELKVRCPIWLTYSAYLYNRDAPTGQLEHIDSSNELKRAKERMTSK